MFERKRKKERIYIFPSAYLWPYCTNLRCTVYKTKQWNTDGEYELLMPVISDKLYEDKPTVMRQADLDSNTK